MKTVVKENANGGKGQVVVKYILDDNELNAKCKMFAEVTIAPGCSLGYHEHHGESETYYIIKGQAAGNERLRSRNAAFGSQYELASYLYNFLSSHLKTEDIELRMGNIALLYRLLQRLQLTGLKDITPILRSVKFEKDRRTISQQIIDQIISGNEKRYQCYQELRTEPETASPETLQAVNQFLEEWVPLERLLNKTARRTSTRSRGAFNINTLKRMDLFDKEMINQIVQLRKLRNVLIHDIELPDQAQILRCTEEAKALLAQLTRQHDAMADGENGEKNSHAENT